MIHCPECNSPEVHPTEEGKILIRGCKVYDEDNNVVKLNSITDMDI